MKKIIAFLMVCILSINVLPAYATDFSERYIYISPNENIFKVKKTDKKAVDIDFDAKGSFFGTDGTMYVIFDSIGHFTANENIDFLYDPESGVGYTEYKYPQHAPEKWLDMKIYKNSNVLEYNGEKISMGKEAVEFQGEIYFPLREGLLALGFDDDSIVYNPDSKSVYVNQQATISELFSNNRTINFEIKDDIFYDKYSNDFTQIDSYIKQNINKNFDLNDFIIEEDHFDFGTKDVGNIWLYYMIEDIRTDFAYKITTEDNKVVSMGQIGNDIIGICPLIDKNFLDEETLFKMAKEAEGENKNITEQSTYMYFDSKFEKIVYVVDSVIGSDDSGYSTSRCYFVDNRDGM